MTDGGPPGFMHRHIATADLEIATWVGGSGPPVLLLHGYPQTHAMWHRVASRLAEEFTVVLTDLRGYGSSGKPPGSDSHIEYAKRTMAADQVEVMRLLGFERFAVVGHDRGARVGHRLALDHRKRVTRLAVLDIVPTLEVFRTADEHMARVYYHWFFLAQPHPLPETLIAGDPEFYLRWCLGRWSADPDTYESEAVADYVRAWSDPATVHATCEDYRAGASIDLEHDEADLHEPLTCPLLVLWGGKGFVGKHYDVLEVWSRRAKDVRGQTLDTAHFLPEEDPDGTYAALREFLGPELT